ncbi:MAG: AraC family transcriptional regulator [Armatimonadetes bacterium]|nr:AraC family transcriptional regulator [Armatimonadota bacterium]
MKFYDLPLEAPPEIHWVGTGQHGKLPFEQFLLPDLWCAHLFRDPMTLRVGNVAFAIETGHATIIPPATPIEFHFPQRGDFWHVFAHFRVAAGATTSIAAHQALGSRFETVYGMLEAVLNARGVPPARAQANVWSVLWELARSGEEARDPLVSRAQEIIEKRLSQPLSVAEMARELGVSHNHLTRRFKAQTGQTVVAFIREARLTRARHLLRHSTLPIKAIAAQVGLGDFHSFGKAMRRAHGHGPRQFRDFP